jgi:hypothetical protein
MKQLNVGLGDKYTKQLSDYLKVQRETRGIITGTPDVTQVQATASVEGAEIAVPW